MDVPGPTESARRHFFIHTFGCQMNESDSARIGEILGRMGWSRAEVPELADLILLNTCAVREKAEQKVLSALGRYREMKENRGALLAVAGCVAQSQKDRLLKRVPYLDFVFGPDAIAKLPDILRKVQLERARVAETGWIDSAEYVFPRADPNTARGKVTEFVTVMKGCDNACSFCLVPHTRGREQSRPLGEVLDEVRALGAVGVREVTLIGQNVNSYRGGVDFPELLARVCALEGIERVRFTTSHPSDLSDRLIDAFGALPSLMPHFHLPVQSGSEPILERMRRGYSVAAYFERLDRLRRARPGIAVTTDIIAGFPGETEDDFEKTMELCERARFENVFGFVYSPRPHTAAARHEAEWGHVPHAVKVARLERLQARSRALSLERAEAQRGLEVRVLVEGPSRKNPAVRFGRTPENRVVNFEGRAPAGATVPVKIERATPNALFGVEC
jgi:tRNA-2-methylthio-N6-dimethylallyladenosine synthase